jgi:hypothetical protein
MSRILSHSSASIIFVSMNTASTTASKLVTSVQKYLFTDANNNGGDSEEGGMTSSSSTSRGNMNVNGPPDFAGYLTKRSVWLKEWRKRYVVLRGTMLYISKTPNDEPHEVVNLLKGIAIRGAEDKIGRPHSFEVSTADNTIFLFADSEKEKDAWISAISKAMVKFSDSYVCCLYHHHGNLFHNYLIDQ